MQKKKILRLKNYIQNTHLFVVWWWKTLWGNLKGKSKFYRSCLYHSWKLFITCHQKDIKVLIIYCNTRLKIHLPASVHVIVLYAYNKYILNCIYAHNILVLTMAANSDIISILNIWHSVTVKPKLSRSPTVQYAYHSKHESIPSTDVNIGTSTCIRSQCMPAVKKKKPEKSSGDPKGSQQFSPLLPTWIHFTDTMRALVSGFRALYKVVDWCHIFLHNCVTQCRDFVTRLKVSNPSLSTMGVHRSSDWGLPAVTTVGEGGCRTIQALFPGRNQSAVS